jgi:hypothetical protein
MALQLVRKLVEGGLRGFRPITWHRYIGGKLTGSRAIFGRRPATNPAPMRSGSALGDWLTQTVAYHH